jgi:hypothetical protein
MLKTNCCCIIHTYYQLVIVFFEIINQAWTIENLSVIYNFYIILVKVKNKINNRNIENIEKRPMIIKIHIDNVIHTCNSFRLRK